MGRRQKIPNWVWFLVGGLLSASAIAICVIGGLKWDRFQSETCAYDLDTLIKSGKFTTTAVGPTLNSGAKIDCAKERQYVSTKVLTLELVDLQFNVTQSLTPAPKFFGITTGRWNCLKPCDVQKVKDYPSREYSAYYLGQMKDGKRSGVGKHKHWFGGNGGIYQGEFKNDKYNGIGKTKNSEYTFQGRYQHGVRHGKGKQIFNSGGTYEGMWLNDVKQNGKGKMVYRNGDTYEGKWLNNEKHGFGKMIWNATGNSYQGRWANEKKNGYGTYIWKASGNRYQGYFQNGKMHGQGRMAYGNGDTFKGEWANDQKLVGKFIWKKTGNSYQGQYANNKKSGPGIYIWKDTGNRYRGQWANDKKHGGGKFTSGSTGGSYEGGWKQDKMDGKGKMIKAGKESTVTYENGVLKSKDGCSV
eukprot:155693_1